MQTAKLGQRFSLCWGLLTAPGCRQCRPLTLGFAGMMMMCTQEIAVLPAQAAILSSWNFDSKNNQLELMVQEGAQPSFSVLSQPPRIVLDLPNTDLGVNPSQKTYSGTVRQIEVSQIQGGTTRIVMEFDPAVVLDPAQVRLQRVSAPIESGPFRDRWVLRPFVATAPIGTGGWQTASPLPPATYSNPQSAAVSVPPLEQTNFPRPTAVGEFDQPFPPAPQLPRSNPLGTLPLALPTETSAIPVPSATVMVPSLETQSPVGITKVGFANPAPAGLPKPRGNEILLPAGAQLFVRYAGERIVKFHPDLDRQEVLFLDAAIFDRAGNLIAPEGTPVIGRFESNRKGSRFVAQAITLFGRNIPLAAQSERYKKPNLLQPGGIMEIRLKEALR
ncbi:AMIN domain-containing protein [Microcoleus sp. FACHB-68]|uniref:AMIN domain-containing protein n=1 Tax=Microcoleus sp. FACHB-68 TaxID=2692826 RepID=UPI0016841A47|nr:AMIN domain-containing protein [Microcoleus sp. FACHB-68]MBD1938519.1 AMIN domain-containing protein [Microcoleus sp. FACHB-68]